MENFEVKSAHKLFERPPQKDYLEEWSKLLAQPTEQQLETNDTSLVIFRLENEWFGLSALVFSEIGVQRTINLIPYQNDSIVLGVVNVNGQLRLCFSLHDLLGIKKVNREKSEKMKFGAHYPRMLTITEGIELFTFPVEEVESVYQFDLSKMTNVPVNVLNSKENYLKGLISWNDKNIFIINEELLFLSLHRRLS